MLPSFNLPCIPCCLGPGKALKVKRKEAKEDKEVEIPFDAT